MYLDIHLFRFNDRSGEIYILAGEDVEVLIYANGTALVQPDKIL